VQSVHLLNDGQFSLHQLYYKKTQIIFASSFRLHVKYNNMDTFLTGFILSKTNILCYENLHNFSF